MRGMSMLQMAGGVAVAGVVAAGATAYTGSGIIPTVDKTKSFIGGTATQLVYGATIDHVAYTFTDGTKTVLTGFDVTFTDATADTKSVTATITVTAGSWAGATTVSCNAVGTNTTMVTNCTTASNYTLGTVNSIAVTVL
jgi:hypothetical protein